MLELIYETHSVTTDNESGHATGWLPGELSEAGREQAVLLGERRRDVDAVFSSDLGRALETVAIAFAGTDVPVFYDWRLRECDYGVLNGAPVGELEVAKHVDVPYPGGESYRDVVVRVLLEGVPLDELVGAPFEWQPGWEFKPNHTRGNDCDLLERRSRQDVTGLRI
jgi:broad specificity phosphatase PhoE